MAESDLENWLHATSVVWELSLPGLNVWLGNTLAYIILHLQKFAASAVNSYLQGEAGQTEGQPGCSDVVEDTVAAAVVVRVCGEGREQGSTVLSLQQEGLLPHPLLALLSFTSSRKRHTQSAMAALLEVVK